MFIDHSCKCGAAPDCYCDRTRTGDAYLEQFEQPSTQAPVELSKKASKALADLYPKSAEPSTEVKNRLGFFLANEGAFDTSEDAGWWDDEDDDNSSNCLLEDRADRFPPKATLDNPCLDNYCKEGRKDDQGKNRLDLLPFTALEEVGKVLTHGASKYGDHNWKKGMKWSRLLGAALRHVFAWASGAGKDSESGLSHLAHAACCILMLLEYELWRMGENDIFEP
jgi:hypothetical protein